jgi:hypothetical protein
VPICSQLRLRLKDYTPSPNPEDYLFPGIDGRLSFDILTAVKRTAIPKPHDLGFGRELSRTVSASFPKDFSHLPPQFYSVKVIRSLYRLTPQALRPKYFYWR